MENGKVKNMVVLKNLPSNLVEEAIVILKSGKKAKKLEKIDKKNSNNSESKEVKKEKDYIVKEAEMLVSSYISKLENNKEQKTIKTIKESKKYRRLKKYAYLSSLIIVVQALILLIK